MLRSAWLVLGFSLLAACGDAESTEGAPALGTSVGSSAMPDTDTSASPGVGTGEDETDRSTTHSREATAEDDCGSQYAPDGSAHGTATFHFDGVIEDHSVVEVNAYHTFNRNPNGARIIVDGVVGSVNRRTAMESESYEATRNEVWLTFRATSTSCSTARRVDTRAMPCRGFASRRPADVRAARLIFPRS